MPITISILYGIVVSIVTCCPRDPGSIPDRSKNSFFLFFLAFYNFYKQHKVLQALLSFTMNLKILQDFLMALNIFLKFQLTTPSYVMKMPNSRAEKVHIIFKWPCNWLLNLMWWKYQSLEQEKCILCITDHSILCDWNAKL